MEMSILDTVKQALGIDVADTSFDAELIMFINGALNSINQLGVGPDNYSITSNANKWSEFMLSRTDLGQVQNAVYLRVRLIFDPPQNSFTVKAIQDQIAETDFRIEINRPTITPQEVLE